LFNVTEDGLIHFLIREFPRPYDTLATICGMISTTKLFFLLRLSIAVMGFLAGW